MDIIKVMVNGIPGNMAVKVAEHVLRDPGLRLIPFALTGPEIDKSEFQVRSTHVKLITPKERDEIIKSIKEEEGDFISVDYTMPDAVNANASFYCSQDLPFVMGTTGGDRILLEKTVENSNICAVIAPNMAKQIVAFQAMMEYASKNFPGVFKGYKLEIKESHQKGKVDTSGTAKAMVSYFNLLGIPFNQDEIIKERDPEVQRSQWGIPEEYLDGHGWHTYTLTSADGTVQFQFKHNVNGRDVYALGTIDAIYYLNKKLAQGNKGQVFSMMDVLKGV